jgi:hypothetical protein
MPGLPPIEGVKSYEPKVSERLDLGDGVFGEKIVEYLILPTRGGTVVIPAVELVAFDPESKAYRSVKSEPVRLTIQGEVTSTPRGSGPAKDNVIGRDIRPPRPARALSSRDPAAALSPVAFWLFILPLGLLLGQSGYGRLRRRLSRQTDRSIRRALAKQVRAHLGQAEAAARRGAASECLTELSAGIRVQLFQQLGERVEGLTRAELGERMVGAGFERELIDGTLAELEQCDFGRFARATSDTDRLGESLRRVQALLMDLARAAVTVGRGATR